MMSVFVFVFGGGGGGGGVYTIHKSTWEFKSFNPWYITIIYSFYDDPELFVSTFCE